MYKKNIKWLLMVYIVLINLMLTGCWDKIEIDERTFALALGIDYIEPEEAPTQKEMEEVFQRENHYRVTYVFPKQMGGLTEPEVANIQMSSIGENIFLVERQLNTRLDNELFLGHLKSVVVGESVVKDPKMFREVLDALEKDPHISRKISFSVVEGEAKEALGVEPKLEPFTGQFLTDLFRGRGRTERAPLGDLNDILISLHNNGNAPIPRLVIGDEELKTGGAAIINNFELAGWLGEIETITLMILRNEVILTNLNIKDGGTLIPFQITEIHREFNLSEENGKLKMQIDVEAEGDLMQQTFNPPKDVLDPAYLEKLQAQINERVQGALAHTVEVLQQDLKTDVLGFDEYIRKTHPKIWSRVGEDWREIFPTVDVEIIVDAKIRRVGLTR